MANFMLKVVHEYYLTHKYYHVYARVLSELSKICIEKCKLDSGHCFKVPGLDERQA